MPNGRPAPLAMELLFADYSRDEVQLTDKDPRLVGSWLGDICTVLQGGGYFRDVVLTFTDTTLTMDAPSDNAFVGEYFCDTRVMPMKLHWHSPTGLVRGLYTFGSNPETLVLAWNRASARVCPVNLNDSESVFTGAYQASRNLRIAGGLERMIE